MNSECPFLAGRRFRSVFRPLPAALFAISVLLGSFAPAAAGEDAEDAVRAFLAKHGVQEGFDAARNRFVFVGDCAREVPDLSSPDFLKMREQAFLVAVFSAKRELIETLERNIAVEGSVSLEDKDGETVQTSRSVVDIFSKRLVRGATVLRAEESWSDGIYRTAVALAWSEKQERAALAAFSGAGADTPDEENDAEWKAWTKRTDFARRIGPAQFTDARGVYRYAGIGCADVEGKTGKALLTARKVAEKKAEQSLVYSLWADTAAHDRAVTMLRERASDAGEESDAEEDFVSSIFQACQGRHVLKRKVFEGTVKHPLTGRNIFVFVAGIDPATLSETDLSEDED